MKVNDIQYEIQRRLVSAKSYGLSQFHIHGIGEKNIVNINKCLKELKTKDELSFTEKTIYTNIGQKVFIVEIII